MTEDYEALRMERGWPTPMHMVRAADALDLLCIPKYGDVLRWVAGLCDDSLAAQPAAGANQPLMAAELAPTRKQMVGALVRDGWSPAVAEAAIGADPLDIDPNTLTAHERVMAMMASPVPGDAKRMVETFELGAGCVILDELCIEYAYEGWSLGRDVTGWTAAVWTRQDRHEFDGESAPEAVSGLVDVVEEMS